MKIITLFAAIALSAATPTCMSDFGTCLQIAVVTGANQTPVTGAQLRITRTDGSVVEGVGPLASEYIAQGACSGEMLINVTHPNYQPTSVVYRPMVSRPARSNTTTERIFITVVPFCVPR